MNPRKNAAYLTPLLTVLLAIPALGADQKSSHQGGSKGSDHQKSSQTNKHSEPQREEGNLEALSREVEEHLSLAALYRADGISPQEIQEVKELLDKNYTRTPRGADLKTRVYIELARIYDFQGISPMAIKLLQDAIVDLEEFPEAEITLREELIDVYRGLGFAPQAIQEHKRIRSLRARISKAP